MPRPPINSIRYVRGFPTVTPEEISEHGTRGQVPDTSKKIIVCLGCSHTHGLTDAEHSWPAYLQRLVGGDFQVLNMGRRNYGLELLVRWYREFAISLNPHGVVVQVPSFNRQPFPGRQKPESIRYTANYGALDVHRGRRRLDDELRSVAGRMIRADVERLVGLLTSARDGGAQIAAMLFYTADYDPDVLYPLVRKSHDSIAKACADNEIPLCRDTQLSRDHFRSSGLLLEDGSHPNAAGNRKIAGAVCNLMKGSWPWT